MSEPMMGAVPRPVGLPSNALASLALWCAVFLGGFVFREPAPYELFLAVLAPIWLLGGLTIPRAIGPLIVLMLLFAVGGILATTQSRTIDTEPVYVGVSVFLAFSSCFFAAVIAADPARRARQVANAWIATAVATVTLGIVGYMGLTPGGLFTRYDRVAGGFEDPNVFGPFLVFPFVVLVQRVLIRPLSAMTLVHGVLGFYVLLGIFLSFSRGAWGLSVFALGLAVLTVFLNERRTAVRLRYVGMMLAGLIGAAAILAAALSIEAVASLFAHRAHVVQDYDAGQVGRFARHVIGFSLMLERPLGLGALEFGHLFGEDEHNIWLKCLTTYGWLGFAAFLALTVWTLAAGFPLLFRASPWQDVAQAAYCVFLGHILIGTVIDIDHWRHVYLLIGVTWGLIAADKARRRQRLSSPSEVREVAPAYREVTVGGVAAQAWLGAGRASARPH